MASGGFRANLLLAPHPPRHCSTYQPMSHRKHHYVPAFLLEQWHAEDTRKLVSFRWAHGALRSHPHTAQHVAKADHLYSMVRSASQPNVAAERDFLGPHVDDPAAKVHKQILASGVRSLSMQDRAVWSRFLVAQLLRIPRMVEHMRGKGRDILRRQLQDAPDEYEAVRGDAAEESLYEWALQNSRTSLMTWQFTRCHHLSNLKY